jgi:hypothetical protein
MGSFLGHCLRPVCHHWRPWDEVVLPMPATHVLLLPASSLGVDGLRAKLLLCGQVLWLPQAGETAPSDFPWLLPDGFWGLLSEDS